MSNTIASNNGGNGILVKSFGGLVTGVLGKVTANNNGFMGIFVVGSPTKLNVTIVDSVASNNAETGVSVGNFVRPGGLDADVMLRNVVASNNFVGLSVECCLAHIRVSHSVVTGNNRPLA